MARCSESMRVMSLATRSNESRLMESACLSAAVLGVFFRKATFGTDLNFGARLRVREFEDLKTRLNTISKLSDIKLERKLPVVNTATEPREFAFEMRKMVLPLFTNDKRTFLKNFINKLGEQNIFVFEFVDVGNKKGSSVKCVDAYHAMHIVLM